MAKERRAIETKIGVDMKATRCGSTQIELINEPLGRGMLGIWHFLVAHLRFGDIQNLLGKFHNSPPIPPLQSDPSFTIFSPGTPEVP